MFVQVIQGKVSERADARAAMERWQRELAPDAKGWLGSTAGVTERLDNFPGFPEGVSGAEFADRLRRQAERFGVEILQAQEVVSVERQEDYRLVRTADGSEYRSWAVLLTPGSTYRRLGIPGGG